MLPAPSLPCDCDPPLICSIRATELMDPATALAVGVKDCRLEGLWWLLSKIYKQEALFLLAVLWCVKAIITENRCMLKTRVWNLANVFWISKSSYNPRNFHHTRCSPFPHMVCLHTQRLKERHGIVFLRKICWCWWKTPSDTTGSAWWSLWPWFTRESNCQHWLECWYMLSVPYNHASKLIRCYSLCRLSLDL